MFIMAGLSAGIAHAQTTWLFSESFAGDALPTGWTTDPAQVERLDAQGNATGTFTAPYTVGNATAANVLGYFAVPDSPLGNTFAMANDDAPPCDCAMDSVSLVSPMIDLAGTTAPALSMAFYHDGRPVGTNAWVEASNDGSAWSVLHQLPATYAQWNSALIDLGPYAGGPVYLRFRYSDNGLWASGFVVDNVVVYDRVANDIEIKQAWLGDVRESPFNTTVPSLGYHMIPVTQQPGLTASALVRNLGTDTAFFLSLDGSLTLNGGGGLSLGAMVLGALAPLHDTVVTWNSGFTYDSPGAAELALALSMSVTDTQDGDNRDTLTYHITNETTQGHAMALDNDAAEVSIGQDAGFSLGCRYELGDNGGQVRGVSYRLGTGTLVGTPISAVITDGALNVRSISAEHIITQADLDLCFAGGTAYMPLDSAVAVTGEDLVALIRFAGDTGALYLGAGGEVPTGAAWKVEADGLVNSYPARAPIVRIHLSDPSVGLVEPMTGADQTLTVHPNPAETGAWVTFNGPFAGQVQVLDATGRVVISTAVRGAEPRYWLACSGLRTGLYTVRAVGAQGAARSARLAIR